MAIRSIPEGDSLDHLMLSVDAELYSLNEEEIIALRKRVFSPRQGAAFNAEVILACLRSHLLVQHALRLDVRNR